MLLGYRKITISIRKARQFCDFGLRTLRKFRHYRVKLFHNVGAVNVPSVLTNVHSYSITLGTTLRQKYIVPCDFDCT